MKHVDKKQIGLILPCCSQKPDNRREQLPCIHVTAFWPTGLLTERFWCKLGISFKSHEIASKTYRPKTGIFDLQMTFTFPLLISYIPNALIEGVYLPGKSSLKFILKINRSVKSSWHSPSGFGTPVSKCSASRSPEIKRKYYCCISYCCVQRKEETASFKV